jgi:uracil-DNA glycosylase family 4
MMIIPKDPTGEQDQKKNSFDVLAIECLPTNNIKTAIIAMVGDAPNDIEVLKNEPFMGPIGSQFNRICAAVRLARYQIYLTNACKAKLPKNNASKLWTEKGWRHPKWSELQVALIDELAEFPGKLIMLLGDTAMRLLIDEPKFDSIQKYRGSFYHAESFPHLKEKLAGKIIGFSFHPSFTTFTGKPVHFYTMIADFSKALKLIEDPSLLVDNTEIIIQPGFEKVMQFYALVQSKEFVAFDIEATPKFITCFSFAVWDEGKIKSMCIPLMNNQGSYWSPEEEVKIWLGCAKILASENIKKILQNGMFDIMFILRTMNIKTENFYFDTMLAQHICYTDLPKGLDYLTSCYTYYPYYKDDGKQSHLKVIKDWPQYWNYNAKDSAYLLPISEALIGELKEFEAEDALAYTMDLHKPLMEMEFNGILTDTNGMPAEMKLHNPLVEFDGTFTATDGIEKMKDHYGNKILELQKQLNEIAGQDLNSASSKQMIAYFYGICMIKPYINPKTKNATCGSVALHRIAKNGGKGSTEAKIIIKIRKYSKLVSTYFNIDVDEDKRLRCNHKISGTVSGRIATEKTYFGTGSNLQNQPYVFKYFLLPDPDWILCEVDLAKAEAHVVAYLAQDTNMIESFVSGIDVHSFNASKIFHVPIEEVIEEAKANKEDQKSVQISSKVSP